MESVYFSIEQAPPIEVFALNKAYAEDKFLNKVNLGVGAYRTEEGKPWVLPVVRKTEIAVAQNENYNHEYLPICGADIFTTAATTLLLGEDSPALLDKKAFGIQTLSGTGALRLGAEFLARVLNRSVFYYSNPTWENHRSVFLSAGFTKPMQYRYWDKENKCIDFEGFCDDLKNASEGSVIILHAVAHNPTGCDPTQDQWRKIADIIKERKLFPFLDMAYQGFASGDPNQDAWAVRHFVERGFELLCAQSFAKNFGLYCERVGNLTVVMKDRNMKESIHSQMTLLVRFMYSNPPAYGSRIVATILNDPELRGEWMECIRIMSSRIIKMRQSLYQNLIDLNTPGKWDHIIQQIGMFSYTGLNVEQVGVLLNEYHIYLLSSGRINMCGLNEENVKYVAQAIYTAVTKP